jgi:hypothetical protein
MHFSVRVTNSEKDEDNMKRLKRGRALRRRVTDEDKVPFMTHIVSPELVKEFMHELKGKWAIFGTPEVGLAARGALALNFPVLMIANNPKHEELLREGLESGIVESCLAGGDFSSKTLLAQWMTAYGSSDSDFSESDSSKQTSEQSSGKAKGGKKEKKPKKEKDKKGKNSNTIKKTEKIDKKKKAENRSLESKRRGKDLRNVETAFIEGFLARDTLE